MKIPPITKAEHAYLVGSVKAHIAEMKAAGLFPVIRDVELDKLLPKLEAAKP